MIFDLTFTEFTCVLNNGVANAERALGQSARRLQQKLTANFYINPTVQHLNLLAGFGKPGLEIVQITAMSPGFFPDHIVAYAKALAHGA